MTYNTNELYKRPIMDPTRWKSKFLAMRRAPTGGLPIFPGNAFMKGGGPSIILSGEAESVICSPKQGQTLMLRQLRSLQLLRRLLFAHRGTRIA